ncbi:hypothetical protein B0H21DRAFT_813963 [Amylocystis lapponica]|nr:hypothetical protein B0H21DRAFT_813963 [Amylocystis lapponica]
MPQNTRHVHFEDEVELPSSPTTRTTITSITSTGPITPPPSFSFPHKPDIHYSPLPNVLVNPILAVSPDVDGIACLSWDFKHSSRDALLSIGDAGPQSLSRAQLAESATQPPQPKLILRIPGYPWSVEVTPSASEFSHVTVKDVLHALYANLHSRVSDEEHVGSGNLGRQARVDSSFELRIRRIVDRSIGEAERGTGIRRLDYLLGADYFNGLRPPSGKTAGDEWEIQVRKR